MIGNTCFIPIVIEQVEQLAATIAATDIAVYLRYSRWGYAAVNAAHILGFALLIGAILPLDLKLFGFWPRIDREHLARVLVPVAAFGLLLAITAGALLFSTGAKEYVGFGVFQIKIILIATGAISALLTHAFNGLWLQRNPGRRLWLAGTISIICWLGALVCGRLIAFMH